ncbi:hypothetical protein PoB_003738300 [Plakobranchus ocellatus]|uniref:Uncharacterized protein n=1 Tax=Plakobranchus ocellatus TaxID=259542 RepID=A0AAV4AVM0_9GAST|nr:hypothetical protein PoB_003738300 [Plakobranchus ocellatus]
MISGQRASGGARTRNIRIPADLRSQQDDIRPARQWQGSNPQHKDPCKSQGGLTSHCVTNVPDRSKKRAR